MRLLVLGALAAVALGIVAVRLCYRAGGALVVGGALAALLAVAALIGVTTDHSAAAGRGAPGVSRRRRPSRTSS